jgi:hypothetical protein
MERIHTSNYLVVEAPDGTEFTAGIGGHRCLDTWRGR